MNRQKSSSRFRFVGAAALLVLLALLVPALRDGDQRLYFLAAGVTAAMLLCMIIPARLFSLDRMILSLALYMGAVGIFSIAPADPDAALMQWLRCIPGAPAPGRRSAHAGCDPALYGGGRYPADDRVFLPAFRSRRDRCDDSRPGRNGSASPAGADDRSDRPGAGNLPPALVI